MRTIKKYETHCHTSPVSKCGRAAVVDTVGNLAKYSTSSYFDRGSKTELRAGKPVKKGGSATSSLPLLKNYSKSLLLFTK